MIDGKQVKNKANPTGVGKYLNESGQYVSISMGGGAAYISVQINLGTTPRRSGSFVITSSNLTIGKQVLIHQATGPYLNKGTSIDESEMDAVSISGVVVNSSTIKCFWNSNSPIKGNFKFNYLINT